MIGLVEKALSPLCAVELRRCLDRRWLIAGRTLAAAPAVGVILVLGWVWWFWYEMEPGFRPEGLLRGSLAVLLGMAVTFALVIGPALLAGTLASEKARGTLAMLLISDASVGEIVFSRLVSRLSQLAIMLMAAVPAAAFLAPFCLSGVAAHVAVAALPLAVSFGAAGASLAASATARRARDSLLGVYLVGFVVVLGLPLAADVFLVSGREWLATFNPFPAIGPLAWSSDPLPAFKSIAIWLTIGAAGLGWTMWRLGPAFLRTAEGGGDRRGVRRGRVPPLVENPLLWKELYIEKAATFGRFGRWLGWLLVVAMIGGGAWLAISIVWFRWVRPDPMAEGRALAIFWEVIDYTTLPLSWLIQWAVGLRAAVAIAAERERGTWDALMTSPLDPREIVWPKLWGSLYALKWLAIATVALWTLGVAAGGLQVADYVTTVTQLAAGSLFMVAIGVRLSLTSSNTTKAMTFTMGAWIVAAVAISVVAFLLAGTLMFLVMMVWMFAYSMGWVNQPVGNWIGILFVVGWLVLRFVLYVSIALLIAGETRTRFDALAGRIKSHSDERAPAAKPAVLEAGG